MIQFKGMNFHALKVKVSVPPSIQKSRRQRADSCSCVKKVARSLSIWEQASHKCCRSFGRKKLTKMCLLFSSGALRATVFFVQLSMAKRFLLLLCALTVSIKAQTP
ncbi:MAG: hypothetical protein N838_23025 [Thiohalocapsa sp. PB-PSB1]|nr:MAG: hypothetical protein N838_23025 [Thiohalocapsa sp. PB-PSB1]